MEKPTHREVGVKNVGLPARERSAPPLALVSMAYVVGYRRPLADLSPEKQEQIRKAYKDTEWASDYSIEIVGVYTSYTLAKRALKKLGHFLISAPVNASLPEANGRYGVQEHTVSQATKWYQETSPGMVHLPRAELAKAVDKLKTLASAP